MKSLAYIERHGQIHDIFLWALDAIVVKALEALSS